MSPVSYAKTTAWTRSRRSSFIRIRATCVFTVVSLTKRSLAISAFDSPRAMKPSTSSSRAVSSASFGDGWIAIVLGGRRMNSSITRFVIAGESSASPEATTWIAEISCSGGVSLSMNPLAPARSAS